MTGERCRLRSVPHSRYTAGMHRRIRVSLSLLACLLLLVQTAGGATLMLCRHQAPPSQVVMDADTAGCPGHTEAGRAGDDASSPAGATQAQGADAAHASPGCDCRLCATVPHAVLPEGTLPSAPGLDTVLHATAFPALASIPAFPRLKPPRHPA